MAAFLDLSTEDDQVRDLISYFNSLKKADGPLITPEEAQGLQDEQKFKTTLLKLIQNQSIVFSEGQEKDIENCIHVICSLMRKLDVGTVEELSKQLIINITQDTTDRPLLRLKILNNLYNMFDNDSISRYSVFESILEYSLKSNTTDVVMAHFKSVPEWLTIWGANQQQKRAIYKLVYTILEQSNKRVEGYYALISYLQTIDAGDTDAIQQSKPEAVKVASQAIKLAEVHHCDELLNLPAVKQLEGDSTHSKLYELLKLFACDKLDDFTAFHQNNPDYLQSVGISHEECLKKIRLLSLCTVCTEHQHQHHLHTATTAPAEGIPYSTIATTLQIDEDQVEFWVVLAVTSGIMEAKLDQLKSTLHVTRCTQRVFSNSQWQQLANRLHSWKGNV